MEKLNLQKTTYDLFKKDRIYRDKTLSSIYFKSNKQIVKKSCPIDLKGIRYKLNLETGDITNYTKQEVLNSMSCSVRRTKILLNMLLVMNDFDWFLTFTFDRKKIDRTNDLEVFKAYKKYINNLSHKYPTIKYITVPERHKDNCVHLHMLLAGVTPKQLGFVNSGKVCCSWAYFKDKIASKEYFEKTKSEHENELTIVDGSPIYNVTSFVYGHSTASKVASRERCNYYVSKYIEKALGSTEIFKKRFYYSKNLEVPKIVEQLIGADFVCPKNVPKLLEIQNDPLLQNSQYHFYNEDYNVLQYWIDNDLKSEIERGLIPLHEKENLPFKEILIQEKFNI